MEETQRRIEAVFRIEWARLVAGLARLVRGDLGTAEELGEDALVAALETWQKDGIPREPGAWLMQVAKNRALKRIARQKRWEKKETVSIAGIRFGRLEAPSLSFWRSTTKRPVVSSRETLRNASADVSCKLSRTKIRMNRMLDAKPSGTRYRVHPSRVGVWRSQLRQRVPHDTLDVRLSITASLARIR
jgi:hypothetical protein